MKKLLTLSLFGMMTVSTTAFGGEGHGHGHEEKAGALVAACKMECPSAKTEHEAHDCTKKLVKNKDAKFSESACFKAHQEHEKHEAKEGKHKHKH